ncbi:hypothetical protein [Streptomyces sp. NPDC054765]
MLPVPRLRFGPVDSREDPSRTGLVVDRRANLLEHRRQPDQAFAALFVERAFENAQGVAVGVRTKHHHVLVLDVQLRKPGGNGRAMCSAIICESASSISSNMREILPDPTQRTKAVTALDAIPVTLVMLAR